MNNAPKLPPTEGTPPDTPDEAEAGAHTPSTDREAKPTSLNPPHTTTGHISAPKFGSAGSGGAELEPRPERD